MMNKYNLTERFLAEDNFLCAFEKVSAKNAAGGIDGFSVKDFAEHLKKNIAHLIADVRENRYIPHPARQVSIPKFNEEHTRRNLGLPTVADKIVQCALVNVIEPLAEKVFLDMSYGYRPGKGPRKAVKRVEHNLRNGKLVWVAKADIENFFDTVNHDRLLSQFSELVNHESLLVELVAMWCKVGIVDSCGRWHNVHAGVRQGHVISPLLANMYLHPLDLFLKESGFCHVRYADDILLQTQTRSMAEEAFKAMKAFLLETLHLRIGAKSSDISSLNEGFSFLGIYFKDDAREIEPKKVKKFAMKVSRICEFNPTKTIAPVVDKLKKTAQAWGSYYRFIQPTATFEYVDSVIQARFAEFLQTMFSHDNGLAQKQEKEYALPMLSQENDHRAEERLFKKLWSEAWSSLRKPAVEGAKRAAAKKIRKREIGHYRVASEKGELIVTMPGFFIGKRGERIVVRNKQEVVAACPVPELQGLTLGSRGIGLSADVVNVCTTKGIPLRFVDSKGTIYAVLSTPFGVSQENGLLQLKACDSDRGGILAKAFVMGKMKNQFAVLKYFGKYHNGRNGHLSYAMLLQEKRPFLEKMLKETKALPCHASVTQFRRQLMGFEGVFASAYWSLIGRLLPSDCNFQGRVREGAADVVNCALNYGYGILSTVVLDGIIKAGLNPGLGFLHSEQKGKPVLVFDLIEEFRAVAVDTVVCKLFNRGERVCLDDGGLLDPETRKRIAARVLERLSRVVSHKGKLVSLRSIVEAQAVKICRYLHGEERYTPFLVKW